MPQSPTLSVDLPCPDLQGDWKLLRGDTSDTVLLKARRGDRQYRFSTIEGYALQHFTGAYTVNQIQTRLQKAFPDAAADTVFQLLQRLQSSGILSDPSVSPEPQRSSRLKACIEWVPHSDGYWILRNRDDVTAMQVSDRDKQIIEALDRLPTKTLCQEFDISQEELRSLLQMLAATGMLAGTEPAKPKKGKFNPMQLLFFRVRLFNPDPLLDRHIDRLRWIWTCPAALLLAAFLTFSLAVGLDLRSPILYTGQTLLQHYGTSQLFLPFALTTALVITLHELGHAFTLKHYGGKVPEIGLLFMMLIPAAYTNSTDSYFLSRFKRTLVVGAGVLVQVILAAVGLWLWRLTAAGTWLHTASILLMGAALFTIALNLNPLAKFDGYYLAVALSGINNLRSRAFQFYGNLFTGKPLRETSRDACILAIYAPFSLLYIWFVFGFLLLRVTDWSLTNIPAIALTLLSLWATYALSGKNAPSSTPPSTSKSSPAPTMTANSAPTNAPVPSAPTDRPATSFAPTLRKWGIRGAIAAGVVGAGFIPVPNYVAGPAQITSTPGERQPITMPASGIVKIHVSPNQRVKPGDVVAEVASEELDNRIAEAAIALERAKTDRDTAEQQWQVALAELETTQRYAAIARDRFQRQATELEGITAGSPPPNMRRVEQEAAAIDADVVTLEREIEELQSQIAGHEERLELTVEAIHVREELAEQGGFAMQDREIIDYKLEKTRIQSDINQIQDRIRQKESQIQQKQRYIAAKSEEFAYQEKQVQDETRLQQDEWQRQDISTAAAEQKVEAAAAAIANQQRMMTQLEQDLNRLYQQRAKLQLRADKAGVVITEDLDLKHNQRLEAGAEVLSIVDVTRLSASIAIRQEDEDLVKDGALVSFVPRQATFAQYEAFVRQDLLPPAIERDDSGQKPVLNVPILIENEDNVLRPGMAGHAHIKTRNLRLYEKIQREFLKLVPLHKWRLW